MYKRSILRDHKGFTLIELLAVIVILGLLTSIAAPRLFQSIDKAEEEAKLADLRGLRAAVEVFAVEHRGVLPKEVDWNHFYGTYIDLVDNAEADKVMQAVEELGYQMGNNVSSINFESAMNVDNWNIAIQNLTPIKKVVE